MLKSTVTYLYKSKNRGCFRSGISQEKFRQRIRFFIMDFSPPQMRPGLPQLLYVLPTLFSLNYAKNRYTMRGNIAFE